MCRDFFFTNDFTMFFLSKIEVYKKSILYELEKKIFFTGKNDDYTLNYHAYKDGKSLYCMSNRDILIWDLKSGERKYILEHSCNITDARTVDFKTMVTITEDKVVYLWDMTRPEKRGHKEKFNIGNNVWWVESVLHYLISYFTEHCFAKIIVKQHK